MNRYSFVELQQGRVIPVYWSAGKSMENVLLEGRFKGGISAGSGGREGDAR